MHVNFLIRKYSCSLIVIILKAFNHFKTVVSLRKKIINTNIILNKNSIQTLLQTLTRTVRQKYYRCPKIRNYYGAKFWYNFLVSFLSFSFYSHRFSNGLLSFFSSLKGNRVFFIFCHVLSERERSTTIAIAIVED